MVTTLCSGWQIKSTSKWAFELYDESHLINGLPSQNCKIWLHTFDAINTKSIILKKTML